MREERLPITIVVLSNGPITVNSANARQVLSNMNIEALKKLIDQYGEEEKVINIDTTNGTAVSRS